MHINQKGEGKAGLIFGLTVLFVTIFVAWKVIPIMIAVYGYEDKFKEECKYPHGRKMEQMVTDLTFYANEAGLPVTEDDITASRTANQLKAHAEFTIPIDLAVYTYNWEVSIDYDAPVFE